MNKIIKKGLLSVALLATVVAAQASNRIIVKGTEAKKVEISLSDVVSAETLTIKDVQNVALFSENVKKGESLVKTFDFSTIATGLYFIELKAENRVEVTPVLITENSVSILSESVKKYKAPHISLDGSVAKVLVNNFSKELVKLTLVDDNGVELLKKESKDLVTYSALNFEGLASGDYTLYTSIGDYSFVDTITIK